MTPAHDWRQVPERVAALIPPAQEILAGYLKFAAQTGDLAGSTAAWCPETDTLVIYRPGAVGEKRAAERILIRSAEQAPDIAHEIVIKTAGIPLVAPAFDFGNKMLGGPTPLSNAIVSGLMLGGLGYGAGALAENLFPERYVSRGRLRKTLGLAGLAGGGLLGVNNAYANARRTGQGFLSSFLQRNDAPLPPVAGVKQGSFYNGMSESGLYAPSVSVPQFNQAAWNDVQRGSTPPLYAAATTGLLNGLSTAQRSPIIRPADVIRGIASAGVGLATANVAGRALSALAGLTPYGQKKLQDMGLWGGMMHAIVPPMFGMR